jgi:hypothetical protein
MNNLAPIILFTYKRLETLKHTVESLKNNNLAIYSKLIIFSDSAKNEIDLIEVINVRNYLKCINGFYSIEIYEQDKNLGLANSIINGVNHVFQNHDSAIILEDDLISSPNFLNFMNDSLNYYRYNKKVLSITGYSNFISNTSNYDVYFTHRASSWGWAIWKDRWSNIDWNVADYESFKYDIIERYNFNKMGSDMSYMLDNSMNNKIDSWAIRLSFHQFKHNLYSIHPFISKIKNIGFSLDATNTISNYNRFKTDLDSSLKTNFLFPMNPYLEENIIKQFIRPFSLRTRIYHKILLYINYFKILIKM